MSKPSVLITVKWSEIEDRSNPQHNRLMKNDPIYRATILKAMELRNQSSKERK